MTPLKDLTGMTLICDWLIQASFVFNGSGFRVRVDIGIQPSILVLPLHAEKVKET